MAMTHDRFAETPASAIHALRSDDALAKARAFTAITRAYWGPCYAHLRLRHRRPRTEAEDLTQGFFLACMEKETFSTYDPSIARFRTFVRRCLENFALHEAERASALKRGGGQLHVALEHVVDAGIESRLSHWPSERADEVFYEEWRWSLMESARQRLGESMRARGRTQAFEVFDRYYQADGWQAPPRYETLCAEFAITKPTVANYLNAARKEYRALLVARLRELTASEEEFEAELFELSGSTDR